MTFKQLAAWFDEDGVKLSEAQEGYFGNDPSASAIYPVFEGIVKDVKANLPDDSHVFRKYSFMSKQGAKDVFELFTEMNEGRIHNCFIEASACYGSCINGPEKLDEGYYPVSRGIDMMHYLREEKNIREADLSDVDLRREIRPAPPKLAIPDEDTIRAILAQIGKTKPEHELNCGSCGYRTCRDKAIAVYQGKAELHMCLPYMTQISETLANVTLSVSLDPVDFALAVAEERNIPLHKVSYEDRGIIVNQTVVYIPEQGLAIAFLHDITKQEAEAESLNKLKMETMEMAAEQAQDGDDGDGAERHRQADDRRAGDSEPPRRDDRRDEGDADEAQGFDRI